MHSKKIPLVCVIGPTASGKTKLSVELAKLFRGEVVSADSMQIYQYMTIGTAKPTAEEICGIPHHCIDLITPDSTFSVAEYVEHARAAITEITTRGKLPILAGGTGLYVSSLVDNIKFTPTSSSEALRSELKALGEEHGNEYLWKMLHEIDPELAQTLHPNNQGRVIRGIEIYRLTSTTMTEHQRLSRLQESPYELCMLGLNYSNRQTLYDRIDLRVDLMLQHGLLDEVRALAERGYSKTSVQAIGYKEFFDYLDGKMSLQEAAECVKLESRRYAKRQLTWFRRDKRIHWLNVDEYDNFDQLLAKASKLIREMMEGDSP
ncbi:tRNA (adenosine(37)-N6)-dimethylallyltransferase MiaA [Hydrogenoanaerobacterium sp.]|uniref:tRNA (adenosine(37)-N6)-dimethylallyltransferase MiaA n=1 Tax=Hydrogenoanaerobacterium sp. TaxID=2953763 RepID=UPI0028965C26|nr:tRNA (adenosine(37)-N6)-dimethylallyltransferase MiaA [Hydrogenoanaerobacterium sp.]